MQDFKNDHKYRGSRKGFRSALRKIYHLLILYYTACLSKKALAHRKYFVLGVIRDVVIHVVFVS